MRKTILTGLAALTLAGAVVLSSCEDEKEVLTPEYLVTTYNNNFFEKLSSDSLVKKFDNNVLKATNLENYIYDGFLPVKEIVATWDAVAQNQFDALAISNYLQDRAKKEHELKRFGTKTLQTLENRASYTYNQILEMRFNPLNQQLAKGSHIDINKWNSCENKLYKTRIDFLDKSNIFVEKGTTVNRGEPRKYEATFNSQYLDVKLNSKFTYNQNNDFTIRQLLAQIEMAAKK
ncbi:hypothetical protein COV13_03140 [Candidatus Woesearchaeota archaeon CG10_big_fil_rev_8_21_14_0_10_32_9]|nr:MAG: hypothetical protein COV13_03140 [Candidatus Woesearchaeota archaeon CG10_big_fil_rev_8_21_14_0_10_32_9]